VSSTLVVVCVEDHAVTWRFGSDPAVLTTTGLHLDASCLATLEYALRREQVKQIAVVAHAGCRFVPEGLSLEKALGELLENLRGLAVVREHQVPVNGFVDGADGLVPLRARRASRATSPLRRPT
jgi:hypothetical protein